MSENIEKWLSSLLYSTQGTISSLLQDVVMECGALSVDDSAAKVLCQIYKSVHKVFVL